MQPYCRSLPNVTGVVAPDLLTAKYAVQTAVSVAVKRTEAIRFSEKYNNSISGGATGTRTLDLFHAMEAL
jgi:hypothetical protein